jgi:2-polyprenyl-3-methyl-5-hydroxy-6-metoxy-1,4-benzoquinol methylase
MNTITLDEPELYFDRLARFETSHWWSIAMAKIACHWLNRELLDRKNLTVIDVGCGAGFNLARLRSRHQFQQILGVEPDHSALRFAIKNSTAAVIAGTAQQVPLISSVADAVTCFDVLQHLPKSDRWHAMAEFTRLLKPNGLLIVRTSREAYRPLDLASELESHGFTIIQTTYVNMIGSLLQEVRGRLRPSAFQANPSGAGLPKAKSSGLTHYLLKQAGQFEASILCNPQIRLPFGHSVMLAARKRVQNT